ncbi:hypothetical protein OG21DRAFT_1260601 [Imleria badia]|nr:hypothetical protein OG21DRAFT_1260601 [Imleria badia]
MPLPAPALVFTSTDCYRRITSWSPPASSKSSKQLTIGQVEAESALIRPAARPHSESLHHRRPKTRITCSRFTILRSCWCPLITTLSCVSAYLNRERRKRCPVRAVFFTCRIPLTLPCSPRRCSSVTRHGAP